MSIHTFISQNFLLSLLITLPQSAYAAGTLLIKVRFDAQQYEVVSVKHLSQTLPEFVHHQNQEQDIQYRLMDSLDNTLLNGSLANPAIMRGVLSKSNVNQDDAHNTITMPSGIFMLRLPHQKGMRFLQLFNEKNTNTNSQMARSLDANNKIKKFDLLQYGEPIAQ